MKQVKINSFYFLFFFICSFIITKNLGLTMLDDGWRHLAMAFYKEQIISWGQVYPDSLYRDFDPWFMWHNLLYFLSNYMEKDFVPIFINTVVYTFLSFWYFLVFKKFTKIPLIYVIILSIGLPLSNIRYFFLRPDLLSGLFLLYFIIIKNRFILTILPILYAPFYYVFWFYFIFLAYVNLILKEYYKFIVLILGLIFGLVFYLNSDFDGYIHITKLVLNNEVLTQGYSVGESLPFIISQDFKSSFGSTNLLIFLTFFSLLLLYTFKPKDILLKWIILFIPLLIIQNRFLFLLEPILYVLFIHIFYTSIKIINDNGFSYFLDLIKDFIKERTYFSYISKKYLNIIFILILLFLFLLKFFDYKVQTNKVHKNLIEMSFLKDDEYKNKKILFSSMNTSTYIAVYLNPSGKYIPSCSLGWVNYDGKTKKVYFDLVTNNKNIIKKDVFYFLKKTSPDYFIVDSLANSNLNFSEKELNLYGFKFYKIINSKLVFRKI